MAETQMQKHLRTYVQDSIQQKIRLDNMIESYEDQEYKSKERTVDQADLERKMRAQGIVPSKIDTVVKRRQKDIVISEQARKIIDDAKVTLENVVVEMNTHLEELTEIEILAGGFVAHAVGTDKEVKFDQEEKIITMKPDGHAEIPIAARISRWKDSTQLSIKNIRKGG